MKQRSIVSLTLSLTALLLLAAVPVTAAEGAASSVADLAWMTGSWKGATGAGTLEENWLRPDAGTIASLVRGTNGTATNMIELIVIEEEEGTLMLRLQQWNPGYQPRSPEPQVMRLVESGKNSVTFEATGEGGLKRLGYSRPADDQFVVKGETARGQVFEIKLEAQ